MRTIQRAAIPMLVLSLAAAGAVIAAGAGAEETKKEEKAYSAFNGSMTYKNYCSNCHGESGKGDGYIADTLKIPPTDLTTLAARNGGVFPAERVAAVIDGREELQAHGRREMPIWGDVLLWPEGDSPARREHVQTKIGELLEHLKTLQAK
jgi:mono/diheme cytochrome c family protein